MGAPARAFVELKAPGKPANPMRWGGPDKNQFERFKELPCWATCNFADFRLFDRSDEQGGAIVVPEPTLRPDRDDGWANRAIAQHDAAPWLRLLERLCMAAGQAPAARDALHLATLLAHSARLVSGIVRDRLAELRIHSSPDHPLLQVRQEFRDVLYAHPEAAGYPTRDFDAQTLAFGLLLVREGTGHRAGPDAWEHMPEEHPLMRTALRVLSQPEIVHDVGVGFDVMCDTIDSFAPEILAMRPNQQDPILYFYEDFLKTFDPDARRKLGVFYTPVEIVRYIVSALDRALRDNLRTEGLRDGTVTILDPATGTGTFLLEIAELVRAQAAVEAGEGMAALALQNLAGRMFGFEFLVGPYAVAHYRLHHALRRPRGEGKAPENPLQLPRLGVYLADTLAEPGAASPTGRLGFVAAGIADERREANRIKSEQPILAIVGNPPYRRLEEDEDETLVGRWLNRIWEDLKEPVRNAGHANQLNTFPELSVAFWRWAIWKLFEAQNAPGRGIVAFISNRKFLTGWPYAGLRKIMRERFDRIEIIDLRGDIRRGERAGVEGDQGVFDIQVGTAITVAVADGSKGDAEPADVYYHDSWSEGLFSRQAKFDWLRSGADSGSLANAVSVERGLFDDMRPRPFQNGEWLDLRDAFSFSKSGMKSGNDEVFVSPDRRRLRSQIIPFMAGQREWRYDHSLETNYCYRPLDRRWFFNDLRLLNRPGPVMQKVWGSVNVGLYALPGGTGAGPAVWCHGLLPDYHAFRGSYGGYAFPLHDRRPRVNAPNLSPKLLQSLSETYGEAVPPEDVFDSILCLLSARSYALRFAEDLEDVFPHIPFPADHAIFQDAVRIGRDIRAVQTFARRPGQAYRRPGFVRMVTEPLGNVSAVECIDGEITLCSDGSGRITGIPEAVWSYSVSGYRLLPRWLESRIGLPAELSLVTDLRDISSRIAELIDLFAKADIVLEATLHKTLTREVLGLDAGEHDENGGSN
jgi:hypothetical protein